MEEKMEMEKLDMDKKNAGQVVMNRNDRGKVHERYWQTSSVEELLPKAAALFNELISILCFHSFTEEEMITFPNTSTIPIFAEYFVNTFVKRTSVGL